MYRHKPQNVGTEFREPRKVLAEGVEGAVGSELPDVHLIEHSIPCPFGMMDGSVLVHLRQREESCYGSCR